MRAWEIHGDGIEQLKLVERPDPRPGPGEVLVAVEASSLNYRDLMTVRHARARNLDLPLVPNSDGAGTVLEIGHGVARFAPGDRVAGTFFQRWDSGPVTPEAMASALGGNLDGVLAERVVLGERGLVAIPAHLDFDEASTLPCAPLTAWNALVETGRLKAGETVLVLGTGGVSVFAIQLARIHGARSIVTSSSDEKLERARELGAWQTINYRTNERWERTVLELTDGRGVDHVVEVGGPGTLARSITATRVGGTIGLIGILTGAEGAVNPTGLMRRSISLHGIYVGSRAMFEAMNRALALHQLRPIIDRRFGFEEAPEAFRALEAAGHFGKIVVRTG